MCVKSNNNYTCLKLHLCIKYYCVFKITHFVSNYTLCVKLHTVCKTTHFRICVKLHTFCKTAHFMQYQSIFFHIPIGNFTLDWIFLHNQRLWWLWQIWSMPHSDLMFEWSQVSKVTLCVPILKWLSASYHYHGLWSFNITQDHSLSKTFLSDSNTGRSKGSCHKLYISNKSKNHKIWHNPIWVQNIYGGLYTCWPFAGLISYHIRYLIWHNYWL